MAIAEQRERARAGVADRVGSRPAASSEARAPDTNQAPQWNDSSRRGWSGATAAPRPPSRCDSSAARSCWPAAETAA